MNTDLLKKYALAGRPLLVKNAVKNWKALDSFKFEFFRDIYDHFGSKPFDIALEECQFFRWKSKDKHNFLHMSVSIT